jgi:hypothetical protein
MTKTFPKSRVCVLDAYPSLEDGIKTALKFANKFNISINSNDGKKLIACYCIRAIENQYKTTSSPYPKVVCFGTKPRNKNVESFIKYQFNKIMDQLPFPYCGALDMNSPDLEAAAQSSLKQIKPQQQYKKFLMRLNLRNVN